MVSLLRGMKSEALSLGESLQELEKDEEEFALVNVPCRTLRVRGYVGRDCGAGTDVRNHSRFDVYSTQCKSRP